MREFIIFTAIVVLLVVPIALIIYNKIYKRSINLTINYAITFQSLSASLLTYFVAIKGLVHLIWGAPLVLLGAAIWSYFMDKNIIKPVKQIVSSINKASEGDLNQTIDVTIQSKKHEIGEIASSLSIMLNNLNESVSIAKLISDGEIQKASKKSNTLVVNGDLDKAMQQMIQQLTKTIEQIKNSSSTVNHGSSEITLSSSSVSSGASQMASTIEELSSSMEEMAATIRQNSDNATEAGIIAKKNTTNINAVKESMEKALESMKNITRKIEIINVIAEKTDLLAVNASIEAARAGEAGKGFSVVANEVRKLAESSKIAAIEINELSKSTFNQAVASGDMLEEIVPDILKSEKLAQEIAAASHEQSYGAEQINSAISQLNMVTQENASSAEELSGTAISFSEQAVHLEKAISFFKIIEEAKETDRDALLLNISKLEEELSSYNDEDDSE